MAEIANYKVAASPHELDNASTRRIMLDVLIALVPCLVMGVVYFGLYALMLVAICMAVCFASEQIYNLIRKKPLTFDLSALVTGLILGLNLPPRAPWYIPVIGGVFAIIVVKMLFGGLGRNFANPAAAARVFLLLAYSSTMSSFIGADIPGNILAGDVSTGGTYLGGGLAALGEGFLGAEGYWGYVLQLFFGNVGGSIGETCKIAVLVGGVYLIARRVIDWRIPAVCLLTSAMFALFFWNSAQEILLQLFSGGLMFGAFFMATDYATSPKWKYNRVFYAFGIGALTMVIRRFGSYPEGMSLAILFMNLLVPAMDRFILPVRFGQQTKKGKKKPHIAKWTARGLAAAMLLALAVGTPVIAVAEYRRPAEIELAAAYRYIQSASRDRNGKYYFDVQGGAAITDEYTQQLEYTVTIDSVSGTVAEIVPITQSTMGYTADLTLFAGKTYAEVAALSDLSSTDVPPDSDTSATKTNTALKGMVEECFIAADAAEHAQELPLTTFNYIKGIADSSLFEGRAYLVSGSAAITDAYTQQLLYYAVVNEGTVTDIVPLVQSTMGYTADLTLFEGKGYAEIAALSDLSSTDIPTDADTSATKTNTALKAMLEECLLEYDTSAAPLSLPENLSYVKAAGDSSLYEGRAYLVSGSAAITDAYTQQLIYYVATDGGIVTEIIPVRQSTMDYTADLTLFEEKGYAEIAALSDLSSTDIPPDADTSATKTNTALKAMLEECLLTDDVLSGSVQLPAGLSYVGAAGDSQLFGGRSYLASGYADLSEYDYRQPLLFYINIQDGKVAQILPLRQSTMGYTAEISLFIGKTAEEVEGILQLSADTETSATRTNTALKAMILECFAAQGGDAA